MSLFLYSFGRFNLVKSYDLFCLSAPSNNTRKLLPVSDYRRALYSLDNETVFGSSRKLGGAYLGGVVEHLIDGSEKRICRLRCQF